MLMNRIYVALMPDGKQHLFELDYIFAVDVLRECDTAIQLYLQTTAQHGNSVFSNHNFDQLRLLGVRIKKVSSLLLYHVVTLHPETTISTANDAFTDSADFSAFCGLFQTMDYACVWF